MKFMKDAWRKGEVISALFLDIKGTFPSLILMQLIHNMRTRGIPMQYTDWIHQKVSDRKTTITFDGHASNPRTLSRGLNQGCPLSGLAFQFYNADIIDICNKKSREDTVVFVDDTLFLTCGKNLEIMNTSVKAMMERDGGLLMWSNTHQTEFTIKKIGIMGLTRQRENNPEGQLATQLIVRKYI